MLTFSHPLAELAAIHGLYEPYLFPLLYKFAGTSVIHDKSEYSSPDVYYEIISKANDFIYRTITILTIMKPFNPSEELIYKVIEIVFFKKEENADYSFVEPLELRESLVEFLADKEQQKREYTKEIVKSFKSQFKII